VHFNKERVVLLRRGKKAVAIIPIEDLELLEEFEAEEDQQDLLAMEEALKEQGDAPLVSWKEVKSNAGIK
jgi:PHD/YefM family antitoxin component YafN of YafNO toxin-antitoxin module